MPTDAHVDQLGDAAVRRDRLCRRRTQQPRHHDRHEDCADGVAALESEEIDVLVVPEPPPDVNLLVSTTSGRTSTVTDSPRHPAVAAMHQRVRSRTGKRLMRRRGGRVEPVFGQIKNRLGNNLQHRGLEAARAEWRLIATSHNLAEYWRATALQAA